MPTDGRPDSRLHDWLASRIEGAVADPEAPASTPNSPPEPDSLTGPLDRDRPNWAPDEEELETVRAKGWLRDGGMLEDDASLDPATARMHHLPVSFIGEAVIDPITAQDPRTLTSPPRDPPTVKRRTRVALADAPTALRRPPAEASTVLRRAPADAATALRRMPRSARRAARSASPDGRLSAPLEREEFPMWDYVVFSVGMLAVFLCAFGIATWYWVV
jgi:hypothetical protein